MKHIKNILLEVDEDEISTTDCAKYRKYKYFLTCVFLFIRDCFVSRSNF